MDHLAGLQNVIDTRIPPVDLHLHTNWTDGSNSVREMYDQAVSCGLQAVLFSEHARKDSSDWFPKFVEEVRGLPHEPCRALVGVEARICDFSGQLDCSAVIVNLCDLVIASVHRFPDAQGSACEFSEFSPEQALEIEFRLALAALDNPVVDILGHPFGMCYSRFHVPPPEKEMLELIDKAAENGVAIEINARYNPALRRFISLCRERGARISLGSDAHTTSEVGHIIRQLQGEITS